MVRGLELGELIAEGSFGAVYRAVQPQIGREVAVKVVRPELADDPAFIRSFEFEAQVVARLEHPHIVPLYDYWREPGGAYLVMRYVRGGTAEEALSDGRADLDLVLRLVEQVGGALAAAHEAGVLHRDVKPSNVLIDERGDTYLTDFGIAIDVTTATGAAGSVGSPLYVAPEQAAGGAVDERSDLYGLAVVVFELLSGQPPVTAETLEDLLEAKRQPPRLLSELQPDLPTRLSEVLAQALSPAPDQRFRSVVEFINAVLSAAPGGTAAAVSPAGATGAGARSTLVRAEVEVPNPYRGLLAFGEADAGSFHGRDTLVGDLVESVNEHRFVTVVGASGSGKSSVVRAGLLPKLRRGALDGSAGWYITTITPSAHPFEQLEAGLFKIATKAPDNLLEQLQSGPRGLARVLKQILPDDGTLLLVVDQFEELFTLTNADERGQVLEAIATAVTDPDSQLRVAATVRADFYDGPLSHPAIGELVQTGSVPVPPMSQAELTDAITLPAQTVGVTIEPALVTRMITDVHGAPGSLPLLQYTLTELFDQRDGTIITETAYEQLGGITGALANQAETIHQTLPPDVQEAARRVFGRLVNLGEGTEDTRRRIDQTDLTADTPTQQVLDAFGTARLLSFDRNPTTRTPTVEVAHEALIREWPRLRQWLDQDRDQLRALAHMSASAQAWDQRGRNTDDLYRGNRLDTAQELRATNTNLTPLETDYIEASKAESEREATRQRRTNRRLRILLGAAACLLVLSVLAGVLALMSADEADRNASRAEASAQEAERQRAEAQDRARESEIDRLVAAPAQLLQEGDRTLAALLAVEAYERRPDVRSVAALLSVAVAPPTPLTAIALGAVDQVVVADRAAVVAMVSAGQLEVLDAGTGRSLMEPRDVAPGTLIDLDAAGTGVAVLDPNVGAVMVIEVGSGLVPFEGSVGGVATGVSLSNDGSWLAVGTPLAATNTNSLGNGGEAVGSPTAWNLSTGESERLGVGPNSQSWHVDVQDDGSVGLGRGRAWSLSRYRDGTRSLDVGAGFGLFFADGSPALTHTQTTDAQHVVVTPDGQSYVVAGSDGLVTIRRIATLRERFDEPVFTADSEEENVFTYALVLTEPLDLSRYGGVTSLTAIDSNRIAIGTDLGYLAIVDIESGLLIDEPLRLAHEPIVAAGFDETDGIWTVVAASGSLTTWRADFAGPLAEATPFADRFFEGELPADISPELILGASTDSETGRTAVAWDLTGCSTFPTANCRSRFGIYEPGSTSPIASARVPSDGVEVPVEFGPNGAAAAGTSVGQVLVLDPSGEQFRGGTNNSPDRRVVSLTFTSDDTIWSTHDNGELVQWHLGPDGLAEERIFESLSASAVGKLGRGLLALGTQTGRVQIVEASNPESPLTEFQAHGRSIRRLDYDADTGRLITSTTTDVRVWDLETQTRLLSLEGQTHGEHLDPGVIGTITPRQAGAAPQHLSWRLNPERAIAVACALATRELSPSERGRYLPTEDERESACARSPN